MSGSLVQLKSSGGAPRWMPPAPRYATLREQLYTINENSHKEYTRKAKGIDIIRSDAFASRAKGKNDFDIFWEGAASRMGAIERGMMQEDHSRKLNIAREIDAHFATAK